LPDDVIDAAVALLARRPEGGFATLLIEFINGAPLRVPAEAMAFNQRSVGVNASALGIWMDPALDAQHVAWAREFAALVAPAASGSCWGVTSRGCRPGTRPRSRAAVATAGAILPTCSRSSPSCDAGVLSSFTS